MEIFADQINISTVLDYYISGTAEKVSGNKLMGGLIGTCTSGTKVIGSDSDIVAIIMMMATNTVIAIRLVVVSVNGKIQSQIF